MHRNDHPSAPSGIHTEGDPTRGIAPTTVTAAIMNALQEELANFIESRGITLNKDDNTQLTQAILDAITTTVVEGDFVTHPEFEAHTQGGDPHEQYALESMLGDAASMDLGTTGGTVAAGDHVHEQYELKSNLKQAAYRDVGTDADQVAAGDHAHSEYELQSNLKQAAYRDVGTDADQVAAGDHEHAGLDTTRVAYLAARTGLSFGANYDMAQISIPATGGARAVRISLPVFSADSDGDGAEPGFRCYVRVNSSDYISNLVFVPHDAYGNGLAYTWTPMVTLQVPANTTTLDIEVRVELIDAMNNLRHSAGYVWVDLK